MRFKISKLLPLLAILAMLSAGTVFAADHLDSPSVGLDPAADINDVYAFVNPNDSNEVILALTVTPLADTNSVFSDSVNYNFLITNDAGDDITISCGRINGSAQTLQCDSDNGLSAGGFLNTINTNGDIRMFAGLRDDPFFFDLAAFNATVDQLSAQFTNPGTNFFLGLDTLSIVLGIRSDRLTNNGANPTLQVSAATVRDNIFDVANAFTGFYETNDLRGHGIFVEILPPIGDEPQPRLGIGWITFTPTGEQLYLIGAETLTGTSSIVELFRTGDGVFPGPGATQGAITTTQAGTLTISFNGGCQNVLASFESSDPELPDSDLQLNRLTSIFGLPPCDILAAGQVDRMGRPGINTALVNLLDDMPGLTDDYNQEADPAMVATRFQAEIQRNIETLDTLDGITGNTLLDPAVLAGVLVNDFLLIDTSIANCDAYLAVELGDTTQCGGRTLVRDVIDDTLGAVVGPGVSDFVDNDSVFLGDFPFLGVPNSLQ